MAPAPWVGGARGRARVSGPNLLTSGRVFDGESGPAGTASCTIAGQPLEVVMPSRPGRTGGFPLALLIAVSLLASSAGCSGSTGAPPLSDIPDPVFNDPVAKIALTGDVASFSRTLYDQYVYQDTSLVDSSVSLEVYMTFFGGPNNRGRALAFLDNTNYYGRQAGRPQAKAIWIMGNGDWQYAAYRLANESERWTDRANQENRTGEPLGNQVKLHGQIYTDPLPVTSDQNTRIWQNYSAAYAEMAKLFHGSGRTVRARAFVQGASQWSAFWTECRTLHQLVADGHVADFRCATKDFPIHDAPGDWADCPADCRPAP
jgi:hypothetical protein